MSDEYLLENDVRGDTELINHSVTAAILPLGIIDTQKLILILTVMRDRKR